ncbi:MAG: hypothetical protein NTX59_11695 [Elusimicrobia bacterium]|nr:hypothetical protein [Elusimicrobiota bacterium]
MPRLTPGDVPAPPASGPEAGGAVNQPDSVMVEPPAAKPRRRGKTDGGDIRQSLKRKIGPGVPRPFGAGKRASEEEVTPEGDRGGPKGRGVSAGPGISSGQRQGPVTGQGLSSAPVSGPAQAAGVAGRTAWHLKSSPHFDVYHESSWSPAAIGLELERMYSSMRLNMAMFAPWMVREKTKIYIYSGQKSFLVGEFDPPKWSKGLAFFGKKTVVVYDTGDMVKLKAVIAHELTHLYFESYFGEKLTYPPEWLNEGLAVFMEDNAYPEAGPWGQALPYLPKERLIEFDRFFTVKIEDLPSERQIGDWYLQSYGIVAYLYKPQQRLQFKNFCALLRKGGKVDAALWEIYRVKDPIELEGKWLAWAGNSGQKQNSGFSGAQPSASFNFKPMQFSSFGFVPFGTQKESKK